MVIKLMKREFRDSQRSFLPVIACILLGSVLVPMQLNYLGGDFISSIITFVLVVLFFSIFILTIRASIYVLYTNLYNQSGYELFTLPVKLWQIIVAKMLTLFIWFVAISFVSTIGFIIMFAILTGDFSQISMFFSDIARLLRDYGIPIEAIAFMLDAFVELIQLGVLIFFAGSIANSSFFTKRRGWWTFLFTMLISWVLGLIANAVGMNVLTFFNVFASSTSFVVSLDAGRVFMVVGYEIVITVLLFLGTLWMWDNKLEIMN